MFWYSENRWFLNNACNRNFALRLLITTLRIFEEGDGVRIHGIGNNWLNSLAFGLSDDEGLLFIRLVLQTLRSY